MDQIVHISAIRAMVILKKTQGFLSGVQSPKSIIRCLEHVKNINYEEIYNGRTNVHKAAQLLLCKCFQDN